jgi:hypothetical protein
MAIVSSVIADDAVQHDRRRWISEHHTDHMGITHVITYLADADFDAAAALTTNAVTAEAVLRDQEIAQNVANIITNGRFADVTLDYSTAAQNRAGLRQAYQPAVRTEAIMIGDFLNTLTDAQLQNVFNLTAPQVATLRNNRLIPAASLADSIRATTGQ